MLYQQPKGVGHISVGDDPIRTDVRVASFLEAVF